MFKSRYHMLSTW